MYRKCRRFYRIFRYIIHEVCLEFREMLQNPKVVRFLMRGFRVCLGLSLVLMSVSMIVANADRPVPEDCSGLIIAVTLGVIQMFES